eukprot:scaffold293_cov248-Pinguiococcus_pyrenoidosus.AAC.4
MPRRATSQPPSLPIAGCTRVAHLPKVAFASGGRTAGDRRTLRLQAPSHASVFAHRGRFGAQT